MSSKAIQCAPAVLGGVLGVVLFWVARRGLSDDAYITLAFAQNVALRGEWAVTPGLLSNTATSPLYVLTLSAVTTVTRDPMVALGVVLIASLAVISSATSAIARRHGWALWAGPVAAALLAGSPLMASTLGLESFLMLAVLCGLLHAVIAGRAWAVGVASGLTLLARPDAGVIAVLAVVVLLVSTGGVREATASAGRVAAAGAAVLLPWAVVSVWLFGTPIPDTLVWKTAQTGGLGGRLYGGAVTGCAALLIGLGLAAVLHRGSGAPPLAFALGAPVVGLVVAAAAFTWSHDYTARSHPFHANFATGAEYERVAATVPAGTVLETAHGEVGALAYFCECTVVDPLSDRGRLSPLIREQLAGDGLKGWVLRTLYSRWEPSVAVPAQLQTRAGPPGEPGFPTSSGFGGPGSIAVVPAGR